VFVGTVFYAQNIKIDIFTKVFSHVNESSSIPGAGDAAAGASVALAVTDAYAAAAAAAVFALAPPLTACRRGLGFFF
jgi:hypothetical protein